MRKIKFRAWDKQIGLMHEVVVINFTGFIAIPEIGPDGWKLSKRKLKDIELLQFTCFYDKNGKEIYEGDILERTNSITGKPDERVQVLFDHKMAGFYVKGPGIEALNKILGVFLSAAGIREIRHIIIGNIYENPELIK